MVWQMTDVATEPPSSSTICLNDSRFSPRLIASMEAPISSTPYFSSTPLSSSAIAVLSAVWPPSVASSASGRSFSITFSTNSGVIGSTYVASANSGSVMIVAGLELTSTTRSPSGTQHPARLGAGVVELAGLPDHDRPRPDHQHALDVFTPRHQQHSFRGTPCRCSSGVRREPRHRRRVAR